MSNDKKPSANPPQMSKEFREVEEQNRLKKIEEENAAEVGHTVVYWHQARRGQLANFVPEKRDGGVIIQSEEPLQFSDHILTCRDTDTDIIEFIEGKKDDKGNVVKKPHPSFVSGTVIRCKDMQEANSKSHALNAVRGGVRTIESIISVTPPKVKREAVGAE